jgi:hypothetical protein
MRRERGKERKRDGRILKETKHSEGKVKHRK